MKIFSSTNEDFQQVLLVGSNYMENALCIVQHGQTLLACLSWSKQQQGSGNLIRGWPGLGRADL